VAAREHERRDAEVVAAREGRTLLLLDTVAGDNGERLYRSMGWQEAGRVPDYALSSRGVLEATVIFWKQLQKAGTAAAWVESMKLSRKVVEDGAKRALVALFKRHFHEFFERIDSFFFQIFAANFVGNFNFLHKFQHFKLLFGIKAGDFGDEFLFKRGHDINS